VVVYDANHVLQLVPTPPLTIQPLNQLDGVASFTMPLLQPALFPAIEAVKVGVDTSQANYDASEDSVLYSVAQAFYTCAISDEVLVARRSNIEVARATLENARARFAAGAVTKVDVDRAENALVRAQQNELEALYGREQSYRTLGTLIQASGPLHVQPPAAFAASASPTPPPEQSLDVTLKLRPEFRAYELSAKSYEVQSRVFAWRWAPALSAFGNARAFNYDNFIREHHAWAVGVQLDWLIFDGGARNAQKRLAAAQAAESQAQAEVLADSIRDDIANSRSQLTTKDHGRVAAERQVALSRETIDLVRTQYEAGTATQLDLLQAQDNLVAAELTLAQAHFDVATADLSLRRAVGTFPPR
jgi:outer membrane protein TolC